MAIIATPAMSIWVITMTTWATTTDAEVPILITTRNNISDIVTDIRVNVITHNHSNILLDKKPILDLNMIKIVKKTFIALNNIFWENILIVLDQTHLNIRLHQKKSKIYKSKIYTHHTNLTRTQNKHARLVC